MTFLNGVSLKKIQAQATGIAGITQGQSLIGPQYTITPGLMAKPEELTPLINLLFKINPAADAEVRLNHPLSGEADFPPSYFMSPIDVAGCRMAIRWQSLRGANAKPA